MTCQRCPQRLTRHHDEMKCVSCGFSIEVPETRIKPMKVRHTVPYIGDSVALKGRQLEYKYKQVEKQHSFPGMEGDKFTVPMLFTLCAYCGEEVLPRRWAVAGRQRSKSLNGVTVRGSKVKCSQSHIIILYETKERELVGWR